MGIGTVGHGHMDGDRCRDYMVARMNPDDPMDAAMYAHEWMDAAYPGWEEHKLAMELWASLMDHQCPNMYTSSATDHQAAVRFLEDAYLVVTNDTPNKSATIAAGGSSNERVL